ncbi:MAG TPA: carboxypeptidase-like regulatory domain-containing protein [Pyrinomonadaceae bacterium]|nr:carboxypeptidase-like regulatory domain-containing protein [Pyrinomonadaceae bacterium]
MKRSFALIMFLIFCACSVAAQSSSTGGIKGKVRVESGTPDDVEVTARLGAEDVAHTRTDNKGDFQITNLAPGFYSLTFRKPGLSIGTIERVEVTAGKMRSIGSRLVLSVDQGSIAFLRGSVFDESGHIVSGAQVELARIEPDGTLRRIGEQFSSSEMGEFVFRLPPRQAKYRVTVKAQGADPVSKEVEIDGAAVYRVALKVKPSAH